MTPRVLVYNRGEIAMRACAAARGLGLHSILFLTPADALSPALAFADELHVNTQVEPARAFLDLSALGEAIRQTRATHVYPGYGFLSEAPELAQTVEAAGAVLVGPSVPVLALMAHKQRALAFAQRAGLPHLGVELQWVDGEPRVPDDVRFPILLKAAAGGGGRGNLVVHAREELPEAFRRLGARAQAMFGNADVLAERYLPSARHVELQVFGVAGQVLTLGTRDCSLQRKHQKVIEEGPAPAAAERALAPYLPAITTALSGLDYRGAGTLEFLYDPESEALFFLEMNTRIQVEHTVTEWLYGIDLVTWQLREACHIDAAALAHEALAPRGHALEARLYAEDATQGFQPDTGLLHHVHLPRLPFVRWDVGVGEGGRISPHYDPMIAKLVVWGATRQQAIARAQLALAHTEVHGASTNLSFLQALLSSEAFGKDRHDTSFIERAFLPSFERPAELDTAVEARALAQVHGPKAEGTPRDPRESTWKIRHRS